MDPGEALTVLDVLRSADIRFVLDGGWGVDALVGEQTRYHDDLDLVVARSHCDRATRALEEHGFELVPDPQPGLPARLVLCRPGDNRVDLHLVVFDSAGNGWQELTGGGWCLYGGAHLSTEGSIAGRTVPCITPELQVQHHLGYALTEPDRHDLRLLARRFGTPLPPSLDEQGAVDRR